MYHAYIYDSTLATALRKKHLEAYTAYQRHGRYIVFNQNTPNKKSCKGSYTGVNRASSIMKSLSILSNEFKVLRA